jgi:hypothetical protein
MSSISPWPLSPKIFGLIVKGGDTMTSADNLDNIKGLVEQKLDEAEPLVEKATEGRSKDSTS